MSNYCDGVMYDYHHYFQMQLYLWLWILSVTFIDSSIKTYEEEAGRGGGKGESVEKNSLINKNAEL